MPMQNVPVHGQCPRLRIKRSGFEPWRGTLCRVLGQDTLLSRCLSPPRCINEYQQEHVMVGSQVAHQAGAYPSFCSMKRLGVFLLPPGWDASPLQGAVASLLVRSSPDQSFWVWALAGDIALCSWATSRSQICSQWLFTFHSCLSIDQSPGVGLLRIP